MRMELVPHADHSELCCIGNGSTASKVRDRTQEEFKFSDGGTRDTEVIESSTSTVAAPLLKGNSETRFCKLLGAAFTRSEDRHQSGGDMDVFEVQFFISVGADLVDGDLLDVKMIVFGVASPCYVDLISPCDPGCTCELDAEYNVLRLRCYRWDRVITTFHVHVNWDSPSLFSVTISR